jgi:hypothetical protein
MISACGHIAALPLIVIQGSCPWDPYALSLKDKERRAILGPLQPKVFMGPRHKAWEDDGVGIVGFRDNRFTYTNRD